MHPEWNEVRARAAAFAKRWKDAGYEKGETQTFYNEFFQLFGVKFLDVGSYEKHIKMLSSKSGFIDVFWPGKLLVEQKSAGKSLEDALHQAGTYCIALPEVDRPRFILASDFQEFVLRDLKKQKSLYFPLADLPKHVESFGFIMGSPPGILLPQDPATITAAELVGKLHDALSEAGYAGPGLERFLVRVVFCLFADDTGIFGPNLFHEYLEDNTDVDGSDVGKTLADVFGILNNPEAKRMSTLNAGIAGFPYVDGALFEGRLDIPAFNATMRARLLDASRFDWSNISPAIFGALFQSVMDPAQRRAQGAHYTTEENILKVIRPLFMDDLRREFKRLKARKDTHRRAELQRFRQRLGQLKFFDPACGCGNFLVIAYRELRLLEIEVLKEIHPRPNTAEQETIDVGWESLVNVDQFYGIEIGEFPARIAETALWMMDHLMNNKLSDEFGQAYVRIPLRESPHIVCGDALEVDWARKVLRPKDCSYVLGNPPFAGKKEQTARQRAQVRAIAAPGSGGGTLDYVCAWFIKAGNYLQGSRARIGFVATSSITQGEQVGQIWPILFERCGLEISFAHQAFVWGSDARGKAHVHVVILGLDRREAAPQKKRLFTYSDAHGTPKGSDHAVLSPYLFDAGGLANPRLTVREEREPINGLRRLKTGVQMIDDGILTFQQDEYEAFVAKEPGSRKYFRKYVGGEEYINGFHRWILYLADSSPEDLRQLPGVKDRVKRVRKYRASSSRPSTVAMADRPTKVGVDERLSVPFLVFPNTSSERREYLPIGWLTPETIANQNLRILADATLAEFALLTSAMHMTWMRAVGGRLESRYRYAVVLVYNTFPTPPGFATGKLNLSKLEPLAQAVLDARAAHPKATLADLYDPDLMPPDLRKAHRALDRAVDQLYRRKRFESERERVEHLFALYEKMCEPLDAATRAKPKRRRKR